MKKVAKGVRNKKMNLLFTPSSKTNNVNHNKYIKQKIKNKFNLRIH